MSLILAFLTLLSPLGFAQTPEDTKIDTKAEHPLVNKKLSTKLKDLVKGALIVSREEESVVFLKLRDHSYTSHTQILFARSVGTRVEMIGTGSVVGEQISKNGKDKELIVQLDRDSVVKYPQQGDFAVPLSDPTATSIGDKKEQVDYLKPEDEKKKKSKQYEGYFEIGWGKVSAKLQTNSMVNTVTAGAPSNVEYADQDKQVQSYRFPVEHLVYYSAYFPVGIEYDTYNGDFPTRQYVGTVVTSSETVTKISLAYQFNKILKDRLRLIPRITLLNDQFTTSNVDEYLFSTVTTGMGFGLKAAYEFVGNTWVKSKNDFFMQLQNIYGEFTYYPSINASDSNISRGTSSSGSHGTDYRLGATALIWLDFVPFIKRFVVQASYGARAYGLKFSGATTSAGNGSTTTILPNGASDESEKDYRFFIGVRFADPIQLMFADKKKKE